MLGSMLTGKTLIGVRKSVAKAGKGLNPMDPMSQNF